MGLRRERICSVYTWSSVGVKEDGDGMRGGWDCIP